MPMRSEVIIVHQLASAASVHIDRRCRATAACDLQDAWSRTREDCAQLLGVLVRLQPRSHEGRHAMLCNLKAYLMRDDQVGNFLASGARFQADGWSLGVGSGTGTVRTTLPRYPVVPV